MFKQLESAKNWYAKYKVWKAALKSKSRIRYFIVDNIETFSVALVIALMVREFAVQTSLVYSGSMVPTMAIKDRLIVNKLTYLAKTPKRGDIIVFESPSGDGREFVKRLVGLPNETIEVRDGLIFIDDTLTVFPGVRIIRDFSNYGPYTIPNNQYFFMGDNRSNSSDSRIWGTVPRESIIGHAYLTFWPFNHIQTLK